MRALWSSRPNCSDNVSQKFPRTRLLSDQSQFVTQPGTPEIWLRVKQQSWFVACLACEQLFFNLVCLKSLDVASWRSKGASSESGLKTFWSKWPGTRCTTSMFWILRFKTTKLKLWCLSLGSHCWNCLHHLFLHYRMAEPDLSSAANAFCEEAPDDEGWSWSSVRLVATSCQRLQGCGESQ